MFILLVDIILPNKMSVATLPLAFKVGPISFNLNRLLTFVPFTISRSLTYSKVTQLVVVHKLYFRSTSTNFIKRT